MKYALIQNHQIIRTAEFDAAPPVLAEAKGMVWLELVETAPPKYDPITHDLSPADPVILDGKCVTQWAVVAMPAEIAAGNKLEHDQQLADTVLRDTAKADVLIKYLLTHSAAEIQTKVQADITTLATAKTMIARLAVAVGVLARRELR